MDIAVLGIRVENGDVIKASAALGGLEVASTKAEAAAQRLTRRMALQEIAARQMDEEMGRGGRTMALMEIEARKMDQEFGQTSRAMALIEIEARKMNDAMDQSTHAIEHGTASHEPHIHGLSRIGNSLAALVGHATGVPPVIEKIADALAIMSFGHLATVGVLAGFAAIAFAYEKITEKAREAAKETEAARVKIAEAANAGQTDPIREAARKLQFGEPFDKEHKLVPISEFAPGAFEGSMADLQGKLRSLQEQFYATTNGFTQIAIQKQIVGVKQALAPMEKLRDDMRLAGANVASQPGENAGTLPGVRVEALSQEAIKKAREKAEKEAADEAERIFKASIDQRAEEWNHFNTEQREAYKRTSEETVRDFERAQEEELALAIHRQNEETANAKKEYDKQTADAIKAVEAEQKYRADMHKEWLRGLDQVLTGGLRSWSSFFDSVFGLFRRLMARMEAEGDDQKSPGKYKALQIGSAVIGAGLAGFQTGQALYSDSHSAGGNLARGALAGAAQGAAIGSAFGPWGAAAGAVAGLAGGILGVGKAAREAEKRLGEMQRALAISMEGLKASVSGDQLGVAIAQINAEREQKRREYEDAYAGGKNEAERYRLINQMNALEDKRISLLKQEYELQKSRTFEDLQVRLLVAQGRTSEADAMRLMLAQQREYLDLVKSFGDEIDPTEAATLALLNQIHAQEKLKTATDQASTSALNMVLGYKYQAAFFNAMTARSPSGAPLNAMSSGGLSGDLTLTLVLSSGEVLGKTVLTDFQRRKGLGDQSLRAVLQS